MSKIYTCSSLVDVELGDFLSKTLYEKHWQIYRYNAGVPYPWGLASLFDTSREIFYYKWPPFINTSSGFCLKGTVLLAGRYEWPFALEMKGSAAESIDGLSNSYISYKLKATITRGRLGSALHAYRHVRVLRVWSLDALNQSGPAREGGVWLDKIDYQFCVPQTAIIFGTALNIQMHLTPLLKGLRIGICNCTLVESQEFRMPGSPPGTSF